MASKEPIHSGHFMTSNPHTEIQGDDEDEDMEVDVVDVDEPSPMQPADKSVGKGLPKDEEKPVTFYKFGSQKTQSIVIDQSLSKLNKCIRVAYMKMTTPKWKDFKGIKLQWKHRIRLNNVIWRAYYMEFRKPDKKGKAPYCYFSVPDDDNTHTKVEGNVLEGMYWKRRMEAVCAQYKRWRVYSRAVRARKKCCRKRENSCGCEPMRLGGREQQRQAEQNGAQMLIRSMTPDPEISTGNGLFFDFDDDLDNEFTNQLFEQLNAPFLFPNPKEGTVQCGNADIMQPGLLSLQPSIEEIMSTDYPFAADETSQLIDPVEFAASLPITGGGETVAGTARQQYSRGKMMGQQQQQQHYSEKEFDAANMLVQYSNQPVNQQHSSAPSSASSSSSAATPFRPSPSSSSSATLAVHQQPAMPVPVITPNISHPLYSQATVHAPQQMMGQHQPQQQARPAPQAPQQSQRFSATTAALEALSYVHGGGGGKSAAPPSMMATKMANQPSLIPQTITSIASSSASQFLPTPLDYSLLVAATSAQATRVVQQQLTAAAWQPQQLQQSWSQQSSQQIYQPPQTQQQQQPVERKSSANGIVRPTPTVPQLSIGALTSSFASSNSFATQSLLASPSPRLLPSTSSSSVAHAPSASLANLIAPQQQQQQQTNGRQQSALALHLQQQPKSTTMVASQQQQQPQFISSLATAQNVADHHQTVKQFVSRYLNQHHHQHQQQQQSPIGLNTSSSSSFGPLGLNLPAHVAETCGLSPTGTLPHYSPATTPLSAPILGVLQHQQQQMGNTNSNRPPSQQQQQLHVLQTHKQQQQQQQQHPMDLQHSPFSSSPSASSTPPKKMSSATLPPPMSEQMVHQHHQHHHHPQHPPAKKGRGSGSFSGGGMQRPAMTKRPKQMAAVPVQRCVSFDGEMAMANNSNTSIAPIGMSSTTTATPYGQQQQQQHLVPSPSPTPKSASSRRWTTPSSHQNRRQQASIDSSSLSPPQQQQQLAAPQVVARRSKGQQQQTMMSVSDLLMNTHQSGPSPLALMNSTTAASAAAALMASGTLLDLGGPIKEEDGLMMDEEEEEQEEGEEKPIRHKRRQPHHMVVHGDDPCSSQTEPADSTLHPEERKRILHLHAEKNRRSALKEGFETLVQAIPLNMEQTGMKCTNAVILNRAAQHIRQLRGDHDQQQLKLRALREKITSMNERIAVIQSNLPSSSTAGGSRGAADATSGSPSMRIQVEQFFERYRRERSRDDYRFWLMCEVLKPIVLSYAEQVHPDAADRERVALSLRKWLDTHWNASVLRPIASDVLVRLATASGAFTEEAALSKYIMGEIRNPSSSSTAASTSTSLSHQPR